MTSILIMALLAIGLVACLVKADVIDLSAIIGAIRERSQPYRQRPLVTANEAGFFHFLCRALPDHVILVQTGMGALIATRHDGRGAPSRGLRNTFDRKLVDFCIARRDTLEVLALVELDDRSHSAERDAKRDTITVAAGYRTLRCSSRSKPDAQQIRVALATALAGPPKVHFVNYSDARTGTTGWSALAAGLISKGGDRR